MNTVLLRTVNIPKIMEEELHKELHGKQVQYEFPFCVQCPEQIVKNLFANKKRIVDNINWYENSQVVHILRRPGWNTRNMPN